MMASDQPLVGRVALVAGATRGCGRAIAIELGAFGATVYGSSRGLAGRWSWTGPRPSRKRRSGVTAAGGEGIAVRCDHAVPGDVEALTERIRADHGRVDVLVNDVWGGDHLVSWGKPVWEHPLDAMLTVVRNGIKTRIPSPATSPSPCCSRVMAAWSSRWATARETRPTGRTCPTTT